MAQNYKDTLNMMQTEFSMRAGLPVKEPVALDKWYDSEIYEKYTNQ